MTQLPENDFSSEWQSLADLRQLSAEADQRQLDRKADSLKMFCLFKEKAIAFDIAINNEFELIKGCGQVIISRFIFKQAFGIIFTFSRDLNEQVQRDS